jgi:hypothetical protein
MGGKSQPDFGDVAASQGEDNERVVRDQIYANRPTQYTPWGYTDWQSNPYTDAQGNTTEKWTQTQGLTPELQDIMNKQIAIQGGRSDIAGMLTGRMGAEFGEQMDWRGLNPMGQRPTAQYTLPEDVNRQLDYGGIEGIGDPTQMRARAENAVYEKGMARLQPKFDSERASLETKMRNQGLGPQDAAWKSQMQGMDNQQNDAQGQLQSQAVTQGMGEQNQLWNQGMGARQQYTGERENQANYYNQASQQAYGQALGANNQNWNQSMQGSQYANQIRQQQITEAMTKRGFSLNEINALLSGQQVGMPGMPNFQQAGQAAPAPYMDAAAQDASSANASNPMNALIGAGGAIAGGMLSDRRMKFNIKRIGTNQGHAWYSYNLKTDGSAHEGVMADEIPQEHVIDMGGISLVNYGTLLGE